MISNLSVHYHLSNTMKSYETYTHSDAHITRNTFIQRHRVKSPKFQNTNTRERKKKKKEKNHAKKKKIEKENYDVSIDIIVNIFGHSTCWVYCMIFF